MEQLGNLIDKTPKLFRALIIIVFLILAMGIFGLGYQQGRNAVEKKYAENENYSQFRQKSAFRFINPLIECETFKESSLIATKKFEKDIKILMEDLKNDASHISIYFRDLNNGPWIGFNENEKFTPASLLKVPVMIEYFKNAESDPGYLNKKIEYNKYPELNQPVRLIKPKVVLESGRKYTIEKLIENMIIYSDNDSASLLMHNINEDLYRKVYSDLMIPFPVLPDIADNYMTVKEYGSFFRILYNASYLNKEMSERALELLSRTDFKEGIVGGVPEGITVSHKYGERKINTLMQLHDCGIVYNENSPYLLCIMSRGNNIKKLEDVIKKISQKVWEETRKNNF